MNNDNLIAGYNLGDPIDVGVMLVWCLLFLLLIVMFFQSIRLVPTKKAYCC